MGKPSRFKFQQFLKKIVADFLDVFLLFIEYPRSNDSMMIEVPRIMNDPNIASLAAFNETHEELLTIVSALSDAGYRVLVIRNVDNLGSQDEIGKEYRIVNRQNRGFDIGAYRDAFQFIESPTNLIFLNTSLYWEAGRLGKIASNVKNNNVNTVTYLTESLQGEKHGQSFFLHLKLDSTKMHTFQRFMTLKTKNWHYKRSAVKYGEKAIYNYFVGDKSVRIDFIFPYLFVSDTYLKMEAELTEPWIKRLIENFVPLNPTQHLWPALQLLGFPGHKKTLVLDNPANLEKIPNQNFKRD